MFFLLKKKKIKHISLWIERTRVLVSEKDENKAHVCVYITMNNEENKARVSLFFSKKSHTLLEQEICTHPTRQKEERTLSSIPGGVRWGFQSKSCLSKWTGATLVRFLVDRCSPVQESP
jgi:hypothetical protein